MRLLMRGWMPSQGLVSFIIIAKHTVVAGPRDSPGMFSNSFEKARGAAGTYVFHMCWSLFDAGWPDYGPTFGFLMRGSAGNG